jgi:ABC-type Co2+ transport system permease subunit
MGGRVRGSKVPRTSPTVSRPILTVLGLPLLGAGLTFVAALMNVLVFGSLPTNEAWRIALGTSLMMGAVLLALMASIRWRLTRGRQA